MKNPAAEQRGIFVREEKVLRTFLILHRGGLSSAIIGVEIEPPQGAGYSTPLRIKSHKTRMRDRLLAARPLTLRTFGPIFIAMNLKTVLTSETIKLHLKGTTKSEIINELLDVLYAAHKIPDREAAYKAVMEREQKMSTGMKHGIAIPHGKSPTITDLVACIGISDMPVDFEALDHEPCRIFIMTLSPVEKTGPHLQFLAEISLLFKSAEKRQEILSTGTVEDLLKILSV
jgi:PTS system nitrogen regulatory IIA component